MLAPGHRTADAATATPRPPAPRAAVAAPSSGPVGARASVPAADPGSLGAILRRCVERRAARPPVTAPTLQRSCLTPRSAGDLEFYDWTDDRELEQQGRDDDAATDLVLASAWSAISHAHRLAALLEVMFAPSQQNVPSIGSRLKQRAGAHPYEGAALGIRKHGGITKPRTRSTLPKSKIRFERMVRMPARRHTVHRPLIQTAPARLQRTAAHAGTIGGGSVPSAGLVAPLVAGGVSHTPKLLDPVNLYVGALIGHNTASSAKLVRSNAQAGSGVGNTRPSSWAEFLALLGPNGKRKWVQGHFINMRLGGKGEQQNLAPFTYSMNSQHYHEVEKHVIASIKSAGETVDYSVRSIPVTPGGANETNALVWHRGFLAASPAAAMTAMVGAGVLDATDAATLIALLPAAIPDTTVVAATPGAATWGDVKTNAETWIQNYVRAAFPGAIACRARYYGVAAKTAGEVIVTNS